MKLQSICTFYFFVLLFCIFTGCDKSKKNATTKEPTYSRTQTYLFKLIEDYKSEYFSVTQNFDRENIQAKYLAKMEHFLVDSLGSYIDSMNVTVDTVIQEGWLVTTQFHSGDIELKYGLKFQKSMPPSAAALYKFMTSLSPGSNVLINFAHLGSGELNFPDDKNKRIMRIHAYPSPLNHFD